MKKEVSLYIGNIDKEELLLNIYNKFRNSEIDRIYKELKNYDTKIDKEDIIPRLTTEEIKQLLQTKFLIGTKKAS